MRTTRRRPRRHGRGIRASARMLAMAVFAAVAAGAAHGQENGRIRGIVQPRAKAGLSAEVPSRIVRLPFREGESFHKGDVLVEYDCARLEAARKAARAAWRAAALKARSKRRLVKYQAAGRLEAAVAEAESEKARAEMEAAAVEVRKCRLLAPFKGRVVELHAQAHETPGSGRPVMTVVDLSRLEVEVIAPSRWLSRLRPGAEFTFRVDETGDVLKGRVERIGAVVDAVSQTVRLHGVLEGDASRVLPGMSGVAEFRMEETQ